MCVWVYNFFSGRMWFGGGRRRLYPIYVESCTDHQEATVATFYRKLTIKWPKWAQSPVKCFVSDISKQLWATGLIWKLGQKDGKSFSHSPFHKWIKYLHKCPIWPSRTAAELCMNKLSITIFSLKKISIAVLHVWKGFINNFWTTWIFIKFMYLFIKFLYHRSYLNNSGWFTQHKKPYKYMNKSRN